MLAGLKGTLQKVDLIDSVIWLNVNGVIYEIIVPQYSVHSFEALVDSDECFLYTYYHVAERNPLPIIVGFLTEKERSFFKKFLAVPGFGPIKAVKMLSMHIDDFILLIENQDVEGLTKLQGVGQQIAKTIVAKLNGKLTDLIPAGHEVSIDEKDAMSPVWNDAIDALIALDFNKRESERMILNIRQLYTETNTIEEILRLALEK